jgi:phage terminase small subunit
MPKERSPNRDKAFELWKSSNGSLKLKDIAEQLGVSDTQIRKWKNQDKWDDHLKGTLPKKNSNVTNKTGTPKGNGNVKGNGKKKVESPVTELDTVEIENEGLTDKQRLFCIYYVKVFNATQAAIKAGYSVDRAHVTGSELVRNRKVADEIRRIKTNMTDALFVDAMDVLNKYVSIAFADIKDYVEFGQQEVPVLTKKGPVYKPNGEVMMTTQSFVVFRDADQVDGAIISEVKEGRDGISVKLHDKMKALEVLTRYFDLLPDNHKRMLEEEKMKLDKERFEFEKVKAAGEGDLDEELIDDWVEAVMDDGEDGRDAETTSGIQEEDTSIPEESEDVFPGDLELQS